MIGYIKETGYYIAECNKCGKKQLASHNMFYRNGFILELRSMGWSVRAYNLRPCTAVCPVCRKKHTRKDYRKDEKGLFDD